MFFLKQRYKNKIKRQKTVNRFESKILSMSRCGSMLMNEEEKRRVNSRHWEEQTNQSRVTLITNRSIV